MSLSIFAGDWLSKLKTALDALVSHSCVELTGHASYVGNVPRYTTPTVNIGSDLTYVDDGIVGTEITVNTPGIYAITMTHSFTSGDTFFIEVDTGSGYASRQRGYTGAGNAVTSSSITTYLPAGAKVRPRGNNANVGVASANHKFVVTRTR